MSVIEQLNEQNLKLKAKVEELEARQEQALLLKRIHQLENMIQMTKPGDIGIEKRRKRTKNAYMFFLQEKRNEIRESLRQEVEGGRVFPQQVCSRAGELWTQMTADEKAPYISQARVLKDQAEQD